MADVVGLNVHLRDLAILDHDRVSFASICAEEWGSREFEIPRAGEGSIGVTEEADSGGLVGVEGLAPSIHAVDEMSARCVGRLVGKSCWGHWGHWEHWVDE
jgi:hypothetical protein